MKRVILMMAIMATLLTSCSKDKDNDSDYLNLAENIIGKWITGDICAMPAPTDDKIVVTFVSPTKAYISASRANYSKTYAMWSHNVESDAKIADNTITLTGEFEKGITYDVLLTIIAITEEGIVGTFKYTVYDNGKVLSTAQNTMSLIKVDTDYSRDILGTWEGRVTSDHDQYTDYQIHRWEYRADGNYIYYSKDDNDQWVNGNDSLAQYFVDGILLCTRWKNPGPDEVEKREWWEIESIKDGVMNWTALRKNSDGSTYTATFSMTKVEE